MLMETEIQDYNSDLGFHEGVLLLNRLEIVVSVLRAEVDVNLDLDRKVSQVLRQLCGLLRDIPILIILSLLGSKSNLYSKKNVDRQIVSGTWNNAVYNL